MSIAASEDMDHGSAGSSTINPFDDTNDHTKNSYDEMDGPVIEASAILHISKNASLTIAAESLVVLDEEAKNRRDRRNCFGLLSRWSKATQAIPLRHVLWASIEDDDILRIAYARPVGRDGRSCRLDTINYVLSQSIDREHADQWAETLMSRAYPRPVKRRKKIKVLINPFGGQGYAQTIWTKEVQPLFAAARCELDVEATKYRGHAIEIAQTLDVEAFDVIAAASGDGLPHEIFNGLSKQSQPRHALQSLAVTQIPCGSGNALCQNTLKTPSASWAAVEIIKGLPAPLDLMAVTQGDQRFYSFLSQAVGIIAESDLGTENLRWMGPLRFQWGVLVRLFGRTIYPAEISIATMSKDKEQIRDLHKTGLEAEQESWHQREASIAKDQDAALPPLQYGTVQDPMPAAFETVDHPDLGNFYTGNMPLMTADTKFFPTALLQDGLADVVMISGTIPRTTSLSMLTTIDSGGIIDFPDVDYRKIFAYRISPRMDPNAAEGSQGLRWRITQWLGGAGRQTEGLIAIDGEQMPFEPFQVEVHQGLGTIMSRNHLFAVKSSET